MHEVEWAGWLINSKVWFLSKSVQLPSVHAQQTFICATGDGRTKPCFLHGPAEKTLLFHQPIYSVNMSMYGSNPKLATIGHRSGSRQDLSSASFRNDLFAGGNGFLGECQAADGEGYIYSSTVSRTSMHGGGLGGQKVSMGVSPGGVMRYKLELKFKWNPKITHLLPSVLPLGVLECFDKKRNKLLRNALWNFWCIITYYCYFFFKW